MRQRQIGRRFPALRVRKRGALPRLALLEGTTGLERLEERALLTVGFSEFSVPDAASLLHITPGPDGNLWYTSSGNNQVGVIDTSGNFVKDFGSPSGVTGFPANSNPQGIALGADGNLWVCLKGANEVMRLTPSGVITDFATSAAPYEITTGPGGTVWFTEGSSGIGMIDTANPGAPQEFTVPTLGSTPTGITAAPKPDGGIWFTEATGNQIGRIDPATHAVQECAVPTPNSQPSGITAGPDGNLWFTECAGDKIGRINPATRVITPGDEFALPTPAAVPRRITVGADGNLWFTEQAAQALGEITPSGAITEYPGLPGPAYGLTSGPDGNIWFAEDLAVGRAALPGSDLAVMMSDSTTEDPPKPVVVGQNFALQIPVTNYGPDAATGVKLETTLPPSFQVVTNLSPNTTFNAATGTWETNVGDLAAGNFGGSTTEFITLIIDPTQAGTFTSSTTVSSSSPEKLASNDTASLTTTVQGGVPDLAVSMQASPSGTVQVGQNVTYAITVTNIGNAAASDAKLTDVLPSSFQFVSTDLGSGSSNIDLGSMAPGASITVNIVALSTSPGNVTNTATVTDSSLELNTQNDSTSVSSQVVEPSDLSVNIQESAATVHVGDSVTYTVTVANNGSAAATNVELVAALPQGIQFVTSDFGSFTGSSLSLGTMNPGVSTTFHILTKATQAGTYTIQGTVTSDPDSSHGTGSVTTQVLPQGSTLEVSMTPPTASVTVGDTTTYTVFVKNDGPDTATAVHVTYTLPDIFASSVTHPPGSMTTNASAHTVSFDVAIGDIPASSTLNAKIDVTASQPGDFPISAQVSAGSLVANSDPTSLQPSASLHVDAQKATFTFTGAPTAAIVGLHDDDVFHWTLTNTGPSAAEDVVVAIPIVDGAIFLGTDGGTDVSNPDDPSTTQVGLGEIKPGEQKSFNLTLYDDTPIAALTLTATIHSTTLLAGTTTASATAQIGYPAAPLSLKPLSTPAGATIGDVSIFTWLLSNPGDYPVQNVHAEIPVSQGLQITDVETPSVEGSPSVAVRAQIVQGIATYDIDKMPAHSKIILQVSVEGVAAGDAGLTAYANALTPIVGGAPLTSTVGVRVGTSVSDHLYYQGGPVISNASVTPIFWGSQWSKNGANPLLDLAQKLTKYMTYIVKSPYMDFLSYQYDGNGQHIGRGNTTAATVVPDSPGRSVQDSDIQNLIIDQIRNKTRPLPNSSNRIYVVYLPPGTTSFLDNERSGKNFNGYHDSFTLHDFFILNGQQVRYIVMPWDTKPPGGTGNSETDEFNSLTQTFSHELAETVTDPDPTSGWVSKVSDPPEIGDIGRNKILVSQEPEGYSGDFGNLGGYEVQYEWANQYTYPGTNITVKNDLALPGGLGFTGIVTPVSTATEFGTSAAIHTASIRAAAADYSYSGPVATFVDHDHPGTDPSIYKVSIDWGDGSTSAGTIAYDPNLDQFIVSGSHTFAQPAGSQAALKLTVTDTVDGRIAGTEGVVTLQSTTAPAAQIGFDAATYEVNRNGSDAVITVTRSGDTSVESSVDYSVSGGTAVSGVDYQPERGRLMFEPGQTTRFFTIPIYANPAVSTDETLNVLLSFAVGNAVLGSQSAAVLTIHPSDTVFAPSAPALDWSSDLGTSITDGITSRNGSATAPLTFDINNTSLASGFAQLYDVTDPAHPVALGTPAAFSGAQATIVLNNHALSDGVHQFAVAVSATAGGTLSPLSPPTAVTIETTAPSSTVQPLPAVSAAKDFTVRWNGRDGAGETGLASFNVFVSDNGSPYLSWLQGTTATSAVFHGAEGHHYAFYSVATDTAGNAQTTPISAQASTAVGIPTLKIAGPGSVTAGATYTLTLLSSGSGAQTIRHWTIIWGDGQIQQVSGSPAHVSHVYTGAAATRTIRAVGYDAAGAISAGNTVRVAVSASTPQPAGPAAFVTTFYRETLGRTPEPSGLQFWVGKLKASGSDVRVARSIFQSPERLNLVRQHLAPPTRFKAALTDARNAAQSTSGPQP